MFSISRHMVSFVLFCFCLHVLWMVLQTAYELCDWMVLVADLIDCIEQWELVS